MLARDLKTVRLRAALTGILEGGLQRVLPFLLSFLLGMICTVLYATLSPRLAYQPWDSLNYAYDAERYGIGALRGNHPLGHLVLYAAYAAAQIAGYSGRILPVFQSANALIGGLAVAAFHAGLTGILKLPPASALGFSMLFGGSYGFWFFAGTADVYSLAILLQVLSWSAFVHELVLQKKKLPLASGILTGLAILAHQLNGILLPAAGGLMLLAAGRDDDKRAIVKRGAYFVGIVLLVAAIGHAALGYLAIGSLSPAALWGWTRGYLGDPTYGRFLDGEHLLAAASTAGQTLVRFGGDLFGLAGAIVLGVLVTVMAVGLLMAGSLDRGPRAILAVLALQCLVTWLLILWWEPENPKFWLLTLAPWLMALALGLQAVAGQARVRFGDLATPRPALGWLPLFAGLVTLAVNANSLLLQQSPRDPTNYAFDQAIDIWLSHSAPGDAILTGGDLVPQLIFWGERPNTIYLYRALLRGGSSPDPFSELRRRVDGSLCRGHALLLAPDAGEYISDELLSLAGVARAELRAFFSEYIDGQEVEFWYVSLLDGRPVPVYRITQMEGCSTTNQAVAAR